MNEIDIQNKLREKIDTKNGITSIYNLKKLKDLGFDDIDKIPFSLRILLENVIRNLDGEVVTEENFRALATWVPNQKEKKEIPYIPSRVLLQDFTGVPAVVDLAALRSAIKRAGRDPDKINPLIPVDLVIDHSIQVDYYGTNDALKLNEKKEFERNYERYVFLKWAQTVFNNFRVVPTSRGICHQVNLEYLASVVQLREINGERYAFPDTLVGTDSHTTMINGLGVLGWGVGGIEAEAVILGQPYYMNIPEVVGVKLVGGPQDGITATDVVLTITQILRAHGVVGKFVEFYGPSLDKLKLPDRATIANMAPEYGATMGFFPVDDKTIDYLTLSGREKEHIEFVRDYLKKVGLYYTSSSSTPIYSETLEINLTEITPSLAGPKRPQDRISLKDMRKEFVNQLKTSYAKPEEVDLIADIDSNTLKHGSVVIAAITSCTNTSNPSVMVGAGMIAKAAVEKGLKVKKHVKTSFAPGSRVVKDYLESAGLLPYLEELGFNIVGYGCTTCIGNSGPLASDIIKEIEDKDLAVASVLSGNRNFEGRISPYTKANYLASPPLVVAYAIAGTIAIDLENESLGLDSEGNPVYLKDIWPSHDECQQIYMSNVSPDQFNKEYGEIFKGWDLWNNLKPPTEKVYKWEEQSTYVREPPFFMNFPLEIPSLTDIENARILAILGESVTTDHISPAGAIPEEMPAGRYLISRGIEPKDFNSFGSRRGNHEVMMRGTFGNIRIKNLLVDKEGGWTLYHPTGEIIPLYDAAMKYIASETPLIVVAGKDYGMGSSRDWAAKGTQLQGVKAVIAESFERIHRSNLVGMGVLPLEFKKGESAASLGLNGNETINISGIKNIKPFSDLTVRVKKDDGNTFTFDVRILSKWRNITYSSKENA
ncbi:MAG: aconitate hydratase AcnA [Promethearchaeota archaeon]